MNARNYYAKYVKRILDVLFSIIGLIILSPVLLVVALLVFIKLGRPIIFKQARPGKIDHSTGSEKIFLLYKFRTMTDAKDDRGDLLPDDMRLTQFGKILRSTSLDELPELFNIVKGDMSIIGPRPLLVRYLPLYNDRQRHRHDVRPGFTGLAQVNGRNSISWEEKFEWDVKYVEDISFLNDLKIFIKTIIVVLKREGINCSTTATMEEFKGTK